MRASGSGKGSAYLSGITIKNEHVEVKRSFDLLVLILTIGVPVGTYLINPLLGLIISIVTGLFNYWLTPKAKKWIFESREISVQRTP